ncbi:hypothetical protein ACEQ8H_006972 [Pleosporales sp. CAS-2024a]
MYDDFTKSGHPRLDAAQEENAVGYKEYVEARDLDMSDEEMKRVRWKLDVTILPVFLITQALQFMDKTSLNYANLFGYHGTLLSSHGNACAWVGPLGTLLAEPVWDKNAIVYAELRRQDLIESRVGARAWWLQMWGAEAASPSASSNITRMNHNFTTYHVSTTWLDTAYQKSGLHPNGEPIRVRQTRVDPFRG